MALLLLVAIACANVPFVNNRVFLVGPVPAGGKGLGWRALELLVLYAAVLGLGFVLEDSFGRRHTQAWEFYVVTACLFLVLAFPGFIWRHLMRHRAG